METAVKTIKENMEQVTQERIRIKKDAGLIDLGLDLNKLDGVLKASKKDSFITLEYDSSINPDSIFVTLDCFKQKLGLILDVGGLPNPKLPVLSLPSDATVNTKLFYDFLVQSERI